MQRTPFLYFPVPTASPRHHRHHRGAIFVYATVSITLLVGIVSLAVDYGRVRMVKTELQTCADAAALATMHSYASSSNWTTAKAAGGTIASANDVDSYSNLTPTMTFTSGRWNTVSKLFSTTAATGLPASRVTAARTHANNNAVELVFARAIGMSKIDVQATAVAVLIAADSASVTVSSDSNPYLAGMPSGTSTAWGDTTSNATPYMVSGIDVVPGTWISITGTSGTTCIVPGYTGNFGPEGEAARPLNHGENYNGAEWNVGPENGIANAIMPACGLYGVFLSSAAPNSTPAPAGTVDWTSASVKNQPTYSNLQVKAPFYIGDGKTTGNVVQKFLVPPGATRLYLGVWDGVVQSNNSGSVSGTINVAKAVQLVK